MKVKYEVVPAPIIDVDKLNDFYANQTRLTLSRDSLGSEQTRFVQLTLLGSACSIVIETGITKMLLRPPNGKAARLWRVLKKT